MSASGPDITATLADPIPKAMSPMGPPKLSSSRFKFEPNPASLLFFFKVYVPKSIALLPDTRLHYSRFRRTLIAAGSRLFFKCTA